MLPKRPRTTTKRAMSRRPPTPSAAQPAEELRPSTAPVKTVTAGNASVWDKNRAEQAGSEAAESAPAIVRACGRRRWSGLGTGTAQADHQAQAVQRPQLGRNSLRHQARLTAVRRVTGGFPDCLPADSPGTQSVAAAARCAGFLLERRRVLLLARWRCLLRAGHPWRALRLAGGVPGRQPIVVGAVPRRRLFHSAVGWRAVRFVGAAARGGRRRRRADTAVGRAGRRLRRAGRCRSGRPGWSPRTPRARAVPSSSPRGFSARGGSRTADPGSRHRFRPRPPSARNAWVWSIWQALPCLRQPANGHTSSRFRTARARSAGGRYRVRP